MAIFPEEEYQQAMKDQGKLPEEPIAIAKESEGDSINPLDEKISTAVIQAPSAEVIVAALQEEAERLLAYAEARIVKTHDDWNNANNDLAIISKARKRLEGKRTEYTQPLNDELKIINYTFKLVSDPLKQADTVTRAKMLECFNALEARRQEQEEINRLRTEAAQKEMELKGELTESLALVEVAPETARQTFTALGTTSVVKSPPKWEVADFALVPDEYKIVDATKVGKVVRAGIPSIPGIRIWQEDTLRVTPTRRE